MFIDFSEVFISNIKIHIIILLLPFIEKKASFNSFIDSEIFHYIVFLI